MSPFLRPLPLPLPFRFDYFFHSFSLQVDRFEAYFEDFQSRLMFSHRQLISKFY